MTGDLGVDRLRAAALDAWANHPVRFREDANSEEDHARGWYRDRVVIELAQNAADAAARAGRPGLLDLHLHTGSRVFLAGNTGAPLDAAGLASMASLRASAKRDGAQVGRFGVGFAAVRSVSDEITVASRTGAVHFRLDDAADLIGDRATGVPELRAEAERRGRWLPLLRLPVPGPAPAHADVVADLGGADTVVVLTLRDDDAVAMVRAQLDLDDTLLLALPGLSHVRVRVDDEPPRDLSDVPDRWLVATQSGAVDPDVLRDRPVEEQGRTGWQVTWAVRRDGAPVPAVVHAPTPTDEPCTVPALLVGTFPLDATRRHVADVRLTGTLVAAAGRVWADLLAACRDDRAAPDPLDLVPTGVPAGRLDAHLRAAVLAATRTTPMLRPAADGPMRAPEDALVLTGPAAGDAAATRLLGRWWPTLVTPPPTAVLRALEVPTADLAELVDGLPDLGPEDARDLYQAFAVADGATLEHLATIPVPLVDGRCVRGARGLVLLDGPVAADVVAPLARWGVRVVHPAAAHPLLERLGAARTEPGALPGHPALRGLVDDEDGAVVLLGLVRAGLAAGSVTPQPWWGDVLLPAEDGEPTPARGLTVPGSPAAELFDPEVLPPVRADVVDRWGADALAAVGVRTGPAVVDPDEDEPVGWGDYVTEVGQPPEHALVVADLDAVHPQAWPTLLHLLTTEHRDVLVPVHDGGATPAPSFTVWWVRHRADVGLDGPFATKAAADRLAGVLPPPPRVVAGLGVAGQRLLGGVDDVAELDVDGWSAVLESTTADLDPAVAVAAWQALLAGVRAGDDDWADLPELPALVGPGRFAVVTTDAVAVADPMWAQHPGAWPVLVVPRGAVGQVADALELVPARERAPGRVTSTGQRVRTPSAVRAVFPGAPATWLEHEDLVVDGAAVSWWVDDQVHAATTHGLALAFAAVVGWRHGGRVAQLLDGATPAEVLLETAGDDGGDR